MRGVGAVWLVCWVGCNITIVPDLPKTVQRTFTRTVASGNVGSLFLQARTGDVTFRVDPTAEALVIRGTKRATAVPGSDAEEAVKQIEITVRVAESDPLQVFVDFNAPDDSALIGYFADFEIVSPTAGMNLRIELVSGDVAVEGNEGHSTTIIADSVWGDGRG